MTQEEARQELEAMMVGIQKYRANIGELGFPKAFLVDRWPWIWGGNCPLLVLAKMVGEDFTPHDWFNMRTILYQFMPEVTPAVSMYYRPRHGRNFPEGPPDMNVLRGWEEGNDAP